MSVFLACAALLAAAIPVQANSLDEAKSAGYVGEQPNGYLAALPSAPPSTTALVRQVNIIRRAKYAQAAGRDGTPIEAVASAAGSRRIARLPSGEYFRSPAGEWEKKP